MPKRSGESLKKNADVCERAGKVEYEIACEAGGDDDETDGGNVHARTAIMTEKEKRNMVRVDEERPSKVQSPLFDRLRRSVGGGKAKKQSNIENNNETAPASARAISSCVKTIIKASDEDNNNSGNDDNETEDVRQQPGSSRTDVKYLSLPLVNNRKHRKTIAVPQRITADGTKIFYLCDVPKKLRKGLTQFSFPL